MISFIKGKKDHQTCFTLGTKNYNQEFAFTGNVFFFHITVSDFCPSLLCRIILIQPHLRVFKHERSDLSPDFD